MCVPPMNVDARSAPAGETFVMKDAFPLPGAEALLERAGLSCLIARDAEVVGNVETGTTGVFLLLSETAPIGIVCSQHPVLAIAKNMRFREVIYERNQFGKQR